VDLGGGPGCSPIGTTSQCTRSALDIRRADREPAAGIPRRRFCFDRRNRGSRQALEAVTAFPRGPRASRPPRAPHASTSRPGGRPCFATYARSKCGCPYRNALRSRSIVSVAVSSLQPTNAALRIAFSPRPEPACTRIATASRARSMNPTNEVASVAMATACPKSSSITPWSGRCLPLYPSLCPYCAVAYNDLVGIDRMAGSAPSAARIQSPCVATCPPIPVRCRCQQERAGARPKQPAPRAARGARSDPTSSAGN